MVRDGNKVLCIRSVTGCYTKQYLKKKKAQKQKSNLDTDLKVKQTNKQKKSIFFDHFTIGGLYLDNQLHSPTTFMSGMGSKKIKIKINVTSDTQKRPSRSSAVT